MHTLWILLRAVFERGLPLRIAYGVVDADPVEAPRLLCGAGRPVAAETAAPIGGVVMGVAAPGSCGADACRCDLLGERRREEPWAGLRGARLACRVVAGTFCCCLRVCRDGLDAFVAGVREALGLGGVTGDGVSDAGPASGLLDDAGDGV